MRYKYSGMGAFFCALILCAGVLGFAKPAGAVAFALFILCPLAALTLGMLALRRREPIALSVFCVVFSLIFLGLLALNKISVFDTANLRLESCQAKPPLRCDEVKLERSLGTRVLTIQFTSESERTLDFRSAVVVATIEDTPVGICSLPPELVLVYQEQATVTCRFENSSELSSLVANGNLGIDFKLNSGAPQRGMFVFTVREIVLS